MTWLDEIPENQIENMLVIDSDILIRLYNGKLSRDDALEFASTGLAFKAHLCITIFTFYEFFKGISSDEEYEKRLRFILEKTDGILNYEKIGLREMCNPEFWLKDKQFELEKFKVFYSQLTEKVYEFIKEYLLALIDGITGISLMVKSCLGKININCWVAYAVCSQRPDVLQSRISMIKKIIDKNFKNDFFDKKSSETIIDNIATISIAMFNGDGEDSSLFVPTNYFEIKELLDSKNEAYLYIKQQKDINCKSCATFCDSYFKYLNRNNKHDLVITGFSKLISDYFNGRKISSNDLIDLFNISSVEATIPKTNTFYGTKEKYWNNEFINKFALNEDKIWKCTILEFK